MTARGFTMVELLVALTIVLLISGAIAGTAAPARAAFDRLPAELEMMQRGRSAIDALSRAVRSAQKITGAEPDEEGAFTELTIVTPVVNPAEGVLAIDQTTSAGAITLASSPCPSLSGLCGFAAGATAAISDADALEIFVVGSVDVANSRMTPAAALSRAYAAGSFVSQVDEHTFMLDLQPDGTYSLVRITAAGAVQPMVDFVSALGVHIDGQRVEITVTISAAADSLREAIAERTFTTAVRARSAS